jgi:uncharacterized protein YceH (UPF0502 family)
MEYVLTAEELRVLGCLLEKKMTTPDYYPLSLNALINACNQKVNREPVVAYGDATVLRALKALKAKELVRQSTLSRVPKYEERFCEQMSIEEDEAAILCVLMLRGSQTAGALRARTDRMVGFHDLEDVNDVLDALIGMSYVQKLPRQPGQKEVRYQHLLSDNAETIEHPPLEPSIESERFTALEEKVAALSTELHELKEAFHAFRQQFE